MNKLEKFILNEMIDSLPYFKGVSVCSPSNLVLVLLKDDYYYTKSVEEVRAWINEYFMYLGNVVDDYYNEFGTLPYGNIFSAHERFQTSVIFYLAPKLVKLSKYVANHNEGFTITDEAIKIITEEWMEAMNNESDSRY